MQRYANTRVFHAAQGGRMHTLLPVGRIPVAPGTTLDELSAIVKINTGVCSRRLMAGAQLDVYAFYVPHRLVLGADLWTDVLLGDANVPTTTNWDPWVFEASPSVATPHSILGRASARYCYNQYFGQEGMSFFANILDPVATTAAAAKTRTLEQWCAGLTPNAFVDDTTLNIPITGTNAVLSLNEFRAAMAESRSKRRQQATGDKYFDILQQFGVSASWSIQMAPEYLGSARQVLRPNGGRASNGASAETLGDPYSYFEGEVALKCGRRYFAEHGLIWIFATVRPNMIRRGGVDHVVNVHAIDASMVTRDDFFWPLPDATGEKVNLATLYDGGAGLGYTQKYHAYLRGLNYQGATANSNAVPFLTTTPASTASSVYPVVVDTFRGNGGDDVSLWCAAKVRETTPVKRLQLS